ncbi:unnamed protein product [Phytophthora fragariaefolia]|uniref:Unnamed protein product n=1 Tax=Phytophthora fragariaefolia TaxID=1490495 RepID=A0A9W6Y2C3_9STRA|nr:unnamed protein product [Phytophthora fragariaefolia]
MEKHEAAMAVAESFEMIAPVREDVVESVETEDSQHQVDQIVARLEQLDLLDKRVRKVAEEQEFVDRVVNGIKKADFKLLKH